METIRFERSIHLFDCNNSWVNLNIESLYKLVSLSKIKVLCCLNVDELCYPKHNRFNKLSKYPTIQLR